MMIVDDEEIIRESLSTLIPWEKYGIEIVSICKNGLQAYEAVVDEYPDIILTDIQMPGYSGLKLIEQLYNDSANIEFIILSGYDNFAYAKEAMKYGVRHYLLKPCNNDELITAIKDITKICQNNKPRYDFPNIEKPFIKDLLLYIDTHYTDANLTLKKVAEKELYLSTNYVSKQFQKEIGQKFSSYLNHIRMEQAKTLLTAHPDMKIYEVAEKVGCGNNPQYFSQLFKKHTGSTPKEFTGK